MASGRATGKAIRIERSAIEQWGEALGGQKHLAALIGRNASRINQIKNAEKAPVDLLEELAVEIAKLMRGERTRLQGYARSPQLCFDAPPTPDQVLASLTGALPVGELLRPAWPFVGRARELAWLGAALDAAARGAAGRALVLCGEAGVGKTSLLRRAAEAAKRSGARAWIGSCAPTAAVAHAPWLQILHQCVQEAQASARLAAPVPRLPSGVLEALRAREGVESARLYATVWEYLRALSQRTPLFIAIDDLHCADAATRHLWECCAEQLAATEHRIALVASSLPVQGCVAEWQLSGLSEPEVTELLAGRLPALAQEARTLARLTRGNPLLICELGDSPHGVESASAFLRHDGATRKLSQRSREVLEHLLVGLPSSSLRTLEAAAVLGARFRPQLLSRLCDAPVDLGAAVERQLVQPVEEAPGFYELTPGLLRPFIYQRMEPHHLADLHHRAGATLRSERAQPVSPGELAHHLLCAGGADSAEGVALAMQAAQGAHARMAYDEAASHYRQALAAVDPQGLLACTLRVGLARAQNRAGHICAADATLLETATSARTLAADRVVCEAALELGAQAPYILPSSSEYAGLLEEALASAAHDRALRAKLTARLAATLTVSDPERASALASEALEAAHELRGADPSTWVYVHAMTYIVLLRPDRATCRATEEQACALAESSRDLEVMLRSRRTLVDATLRTARTADELQRAVARYASLSERSKQPESRAWEKIFRVNLALLSGRFDAAEKLSVEAYETSTAAGDENAYPIRLGHQVALALQRRDWSQLDQDVHAPRPPLWQNPGSALVLCTDAKLGRLEHAYHGLEQLAATGFRELHSPLVWPLALWLLAEALRELDAPRYAAAIAELVAPRSEESLILGLGVAHLGPVSRCLGLLAEAQGEQARAVQLLERALDQAQQLGAEPWVATTEADLGRALLGSGRKRAADARRLLRGAALRAERLGLPALAAECGGLARSA